jgi:hypothetical protein
MWGFCMGLCVAVLNGECALEIMGMIIRIKGVLKGVDVGLLHGSVCGGAEC